MFPWPRKFWTEASLWVCSFWPQLPCSFLIWILPLLLMGAPSEGPLECPLRVDEGLMPLVHGLWFQWACLKACHITGSSRLLPSGLNCSCLCALSTLRFQLNWYLFSEAFFDLSHTPIRGSYNTGQFSFTIFTLVSISHIFLSVKIFYLLNGSLSHGSISTMRAGEGSGSAPLWGPRISSCAHNDALMNEWMRAGIFIC